MKSKEDSYPNDSVFTGVECSFSDSRPCIPTRTTVDIAPDQTSEWLKQTKSDEGLEWCLRILSFKRSGKPSKELPFNNEVVDAASWDKSVQYLSLWKAEGGGASPLLSFPPRFIAQTPTDSGPFCSMAVTSSGRGIAKAIYYYTDPIYDCAEIFKHGSLYSGWRSEGWQIITLPTCFLAAHVAHKGTQIADLTKRVSNLENIIMRTRRTDLDDNLDFGSVTRKLHECNAELVRLERRASFETSMVKSIEMLIEKAKSQRHGFETIEQSVTLSKNMMESQAYDLQSIPKRLDSQRAMIFNLIVQRDAQLNLQIGRTNMEIADTSRRIAEATMRDSAAMKTIAIMTMVFLPATAVATFFSITMFNWNAPADKPVASTYIWVYFVVAVPLTLLVLGIWYFSVRRQRTRQHVLQPISLSNLERPSTLDEEIMNGPIESHNK